MGLNSRNRFSKLEYGNIGSHVWVHPEVGVWMNGFDGKNPCVLQIHPDIGSRNVATYAMRSGQESLASDQGPRADYS